MSLRSFFRKAEQIFRPAIKAAVGTLPGGAALTTLSQLTRATPSPPSAFRDLNTINRGFYGGQPMSLLPTLVGTGMRVGAGMVRGGAGGVARKVVGGLAVGAAGSALYDAAGNLVRGARKRPRSKGITGRELKAFKRVTHVLNTYCKTPPPMKRRTSRSKSCR